nr:hypothetical protein K-LCC10_0424 [Kaumoebavirus]
MSTTVRRITLAETIAKQVSDALKDTIKTELKAELIAIIDGKIADMQKQPEPVPEIEPMPDYDENPDYDNYITVCDNCGQEICECDENEAEESKACPMGHIACRMVDGKYTFACNCANDNVYDENMAANLNYHRLSQCFTGDFTRNYPEDVDYVDAYHQVRMSLGENDETLNKAFNDAQNRYRQYHELPKVIAPIHDSYFQMLRNKVTNIPGTREKIESAIKKLQVVELYAHGTDLQTFREGIKELRQLL